MAVAFIGSAGIPNRYGGFESFLEHCAPAIASLGTVVTVTCDARLYQDHTSDFHGVRREFLSVPANGASSIIHDGIAFLRVFRRHQQIVVLGVSGGIWFPIFRLLCAVTRKRLIVNVDGVEWRRSKFSKSKRLLLKAFDTLAQWCSHHVVYDNIGLHRFLTGSAKRKSTCIAYPGDHVRRIAGISKKSRSALTICRIEPENNLELLIDGALSSTLAEYTIVGNWNHSDYARTLRARHEGDPRLRLLDPIYDPVKLAEMREACEVYLHGHSVGGTNPSLVEMLFYDCAIFCFDVDFNRQTAANCASYFANAEQLRSILDADLPPGGDRQKLRSGYSAQAIAEAYLAVIDNEIHP